MSMEIQIIILILAVALTALVTAILVRNSEMKKMEDYQDKVLAKQREEVQNIYETMRGWRHDYHNHMQTMNAYLSLKRIDEALTYLSHLEEDLDSIDIAIRTGNVSADAIVSSKVSIARKNEISVNCTARVPKALSVSDVDLCAILGNLLDNAIESCMRVQSEKRLLRIYMGIYRKQLYISVSNSTNESRRQKLADFITRKQGEHGFGLQRIDRITEKYDGYVNRKNEPGVFVTEVMLPI